MARRAKQPGTGCVIERPSKQHGRVFAIRWRVNNGPARTETIGPDRAEAPGAQFGSGNGCGHWGPRPLAASRPGVHKRQAADRDRKSVV